MIKGDTEFHWLSYEMTSKKWVEAMDVYNHQLVQKVSIVAVKKNPLTLLHKLDEMEGRLIKRILKDDFKCESCFFIVIMFAHYHTNTMISITFLQLS